MSNANRHRSVKGNEGNWIDMQKDTFTNWVNANLRSRDMEIEELGTGFEDGVKLVNLFEVVSKKSLGRYAKNPKFPNQKMENVSLVLKAMEQDGVKLVSIDSDHVVNGNFKMILGLMWQLILRYQIGGTEDKSVKIALKKLLLIWLQHVIPEQRITNLTKDWNSGIALCNLVNVMRSGLCPEYNHLNRDTPVENLMKGMRIAQEELGIPEIISAEHMASENVDELSMMTYLSYFTQDGGVGENWTLDLVNGWNPDNPVTNFNSDWNDGTALGSLVNSCAPGTVPELSGDDSENCRLAMDVAEGRLGVPKIITADEMSNPNIPELAIMAYTVQFTKVARVSRPCDKFSASGPGIVEPQVGAVNEFYVHSEEGYPLDDLRVDVTGPNGHSIPVMHEDTSEELRIYKYNAEDPGNYKIMVTYGGEQIPRSPFTSHAKQDLNTIRVHGDGLAGGNLNETVEFTIDVGSRTSKVNADVDGPSDTRPYAEVSNNQDGTYTVRYTPVAVGTHHIFITINDQQLPGGPIETQVADPASVAVSSVQYEEDKQLYAELYERIGIAVDTRQSGDGSLSAQTVGPRDTEVSTEVEREVEGNFTVSFTPSEIGEYHTNVYWNEKPIQGSPFIVWVSDPNKCVSQGDGLYQARVSEVAEFQVSTEGAGPGTITSFAEHNGQQISVDVTLAGSENTYQCNFRPSEVGEYLVHITYNNVPVRDSPYRVMVGNPKEAVVIVNTETIVETTQNFSLAVNLGEEAGLGDLICKVIGPDEDELPSEIRQVSNRGKEINFTPEEPGRHEINVYYAGALLSGCPYIVDVAASQPTFAVDASSVIVTGEGASRGVVNDLARVHVDARDAGPGHLSATVEGLKHDVVVGIRDNHDGTYTLTYTPPTAGAYVLAIKWDEKHVEGSPFKVTVENRAVPESVRKYTAVIA